MDIARFEQIARDPSRTREQLETMKANALAQGQTEFAAIASIILLERFPITLRKGGGAADPSFYTRVANGWFANVSEP